MMAMAAFRPKSHRWMASSKFHQRIRHFRAFWCLTLFIWVSSSSRDFSLFPAVPSNTTFVSCCRHLLAFAASTPHRGASRHEGLRSRRRAMEVEPQSPSLTHSALPHLTYKEMDRMADEGDVEGTLRCFSTLLPNEKKASSVRLLYNNVLTAMAKDGQYAEAQKWEAKMRLEGIQLTSGAYRKLAMEHKEEKDRQGRERPEQPEQEEWESQGSYAGSEGDSWSEENAQDQDDGEWSEAEAMWEVDSLPTLPDVERTHHWISFKDMNDLASQGDVEGTIDCFHALRPSTGAGQMRMLYNTVLKAIVRGSKAEPWLLEAAQAWLAKMKEDGVEPTDRTYAKLVQVAKNAGDMNALRDWKQAHNLTSLRMEEGIQASREVFYLMSLATPEGSTNREKADYCLRILEEMKTEGTAPHIGHWKAVLRALRNANLAQESLAQLDRMEADGVSWDASHLRIVGQTLVQAGQHDKVLPLLTEAYGKGYGVLEEDVATIGRGMVMEGCIDEVEALRDALPDIGITAGDAFYGAVAIAMLNAGKTKAAEEWLKIAEQNGVQAYEEDASTIEVAYERLLAALAKTANWNEVVPYLDIMEKKGLRLHEKHYSRFMLALARRGDADKVGMLIDRMMASGIRPSGWAHSLLVVAYIQAGQLQKATKELENVEEMEMELGEEPYTQVISAFARRRDPDSAIRWFHKMKAYGIESSTFSNNAVLRAFAEVGLRKEAFEWLEGMSSQGVFPDEESYSAMIKLSLVVGKVEEVTEWINRIAAGSTGGLTVVPFNAVLNHYAKGGRADDAVAWFGKMREMGVEPDSWSFDSVIRAFCHANRPSEAVAWIDKADRHGYYADAKTYNRLILAFVNQNRMEEVNVWLRKLKEWNVMVFEWTYAGLIKKCAEERLPEAAKAWMEVMIKRGIQPSAASYGSLLAALVESGKVDEALEQLAQIREQKVEGSVLIYATAISALAKARRSEEATHLLKLMEEEGFEPDEYTYASITHAFASLGKADEAHDWLRRCDAAGLPPDLIAYSSVLNAYGQAGRRKDAVRLFKEMRSRGITPDHVAWNSLINAFASSGHLDEASRWLQEMEGTNETADAYTYASIINGYANQGNVDEALRWMSRMNEQGLEANMYVHSTMLKAFAARGRADLASKYVEESGMELNEVAYVNLVHGHLKANDFAAALECMEDMRAKGYRAKEGLWIKLVQTMTWQIPKGTADDAELAIMETAYRRMAAKDFQMKQRNIPYAIRSFLGGERFRTLVREVGALNPQKPSLPQHRKQHPKRQVPQGSRGDNSKKPKVSKRAAFAAKAAAKKLQVSKRLAFAAKAGSR
mmetsp:Transcript_35655/g.83429  ORF Transcript_35655/g.83429 Transcript_35655/m.83429 type:complete len:1321 (-) Transcript_35655:24-3986(-)